MAKTKEEKSKCHNTFLAEIIDMYGKQCWYEKLIFAKNQRFAEVLLWHIRNMAYIAKTKSE